MIVKLSDLAPVAIDDIVNALSLLVIVPEDIKLGSLGSDAEESNEKIVRSFSKKKTKFPLGF